MTYYKATRPDGTDFHTGTVDYGSALLTGDPLVHPTAGSEDFARDDATFYFSVATVPTDCTGMSWPCRLFEVEPIGETWQPDVRGLPNKVACLSLRVVRELDAVDAFGPQGAQLRDLIGQAANVTKSQARELAAARVAARVAAGVAAWVAAGVAARVAAWVAARDAAWVAAGVAAGVAARDAAWVAAGVAAGVAARDAAWDAAGVAAGVAAWDAAWDAARSLNVRDLISETGFTKAHYDLLTGPWASVMGKVHPND
jgi:hypothetical protein